MNFLEVFVLIEHYEKECEPDLTVSTEFKNGVRISPTIEQYHSVTDFKRWLLQKVNDGSFKNKTILMMANENLGMGANHEH